MPADVINYVPTFKAAHSTNFVMICTSAENIFIRNKQKNKRDTNAPFIMLFTESLILCTTKLLSQQ